MWEGQGGTKDTTDFMVTSVTKYAFLFIIETSFDLQDSTVTTPGINKPRGSTQAGYVTLNLIYSDNQ